MGELTAKFPRAKALRRLALLAGLTACGGASQTLPGQVPRAVPQWLPISAVGSVLRPLASVEGIAEYCLSNGLRLLLLPDDSVPTLTVNITYLVGSRHEGHGVSGMAHLLEHWLFKGTQLHPRLVQQLDEHGADYNGSTWFDRTNYYETLPAGDANLNCALKLEADRMLNSPLRERELAVEFSVVRNEQEATQNNAEEVLLDHVIASAYQWHGYGHSTLGNASDIERVSISHLREFYRRYYCPDNAVLVVAGRFGRDTALQRVQEHFGKLLTPTEPLPQTYEREPVQEGERQVVLRRRGDTAHVVIAYHGLPVAHVQAAALEAVTAILGDEPGGGLYRALVKSGLASRVSAFVLPTSEPGLALFQAEVAGSATAQHVREQMLSVLESWSEETISQQALLRYVRRSQRQTALADSQGTAIELSEYAALGDWRMMFLARNALSDLSLPAVSQVASQFFKRSNRTVGLFLPTAEPDRAPVMKQPDVSQLTKSYRGRAEGVAEGEPFEPTLENIEKRTLRSQLPFGMALALLPKKTRGAPVVGRITLEYGAAQSLRGLGSAVQLLGPAMLRGAGQLSYQALRDSLDELHASLFIETDTPGQAIVEFASKRQHIVQLLKLLRGVPQAPRLERDHVRILQMERLGAVRSLLLDPSALANVELQRGLASYPDSDVRYTPTLAEQLQRLESVEADELKRVHRLWGAKNTQVVIQTPGKKMALVLAAKALKLRTTDPDYPALRLLGHILGGSSSSRLEQRLREKEGLSYWTYGGIQAPVLDEDGLLYLGAMVAAAKSQQAMDWLVQELEQLLKHGIASAELEVAKKSYLLQLKTNRADDDTLVALLAESLEAGRTLAFNRQQQLKIAELQPADVRRAIANHLSMEDLIEVSAGHVVEYATMG